MNHWCPACHRAVPQFGLGPKRRPDAMCPWCRALERHRFLALLLEGMSPVIATSRLVVDVAPSAQITKIFRRLVPGRHVRVDLDPAADARTVDIQASLTALPFAAGSVDVMVCYHVLEHVPDDAAAMREIARAIGASGVAFVQVPWRPDRPTDEDPAAPEAERVRRFGQADHVRWYGDDFEKRLELAGLLPHRITPCDVLGDELIRRLGLIRDESVWIVRRDAGRPRRDSRGAAGRMRTLEYLALACRTAEVRAADAERRAGAADAAAAEWERAYRRLRGRPPIRALAALARPLGKARRRGRPR